MHDEEQGLYIIPNNFKGNAQVSVFKLRNVIEGSLIALTLGIFFVNVPGLQMWMRVVLTTFFSLGGGVAVFFGIHGYSYSQYAWMCVRYFFRRRKMTYRRIFRVTPPKK